MKEYRSRCNDCKARLVKYLSNIPEKSITRKRILQKIFDVESQTAFEKALEEYNKIIETFQTFELYYEKALVLDELKRYKEAIEALDEFIKIKPRNAKAWLKKGTILFKLAKDEGIKTTYKVSKEENQEEKRAWEKISCEKEIARIETAKNALEKSIGYFKILIDENPGNPDHWYNRGTAHSSLSEVLIEMRDYQGSLNEYEEAIKAFDNATVLNPDFALAWNNKGNAYLKLKKYNKAIEAFEKAFEKNPNYYLALHNKGDALYSLGKYEEAIKVYEQVTSENDNQTEKENYSNREKDKPINTVSYKSYNNKGLALYKLERYSEAVVAFDEALGINPTFAGGCINKGVVYYELGMLSEAERAFKEALEFDPRDPLASNNLGFVLAREGELSRAKKLFESALQEDPDFILARANLAELLLDSGGFEEASEKINIFLREDKNPDPNMGYIHFLDGRIKIESMESKEEKYREAAKSFEKAASFKVGEPTIILWSVYAKYLCQKFEIDRKTDSSEKSDSGQGNVSPKNEHICSNELSNSIVSDLGKVLNFCNKPAIKKNSLPRLLNPNRLWEIVVTIIILYGLFQIFNFFEILALYIQNIPNIQASHYLYLIAIGLILLVALFDSKLTWLIITAIVITILLSTILLFGPYPFNSLLFSSLLLIVTISSILLKPLHSKALWSILMKIIIIIATALLLIHLFVPSFLQLASIIAIIIMLLVLHSRTLKNQVRAKQYLINFDRHKEIKAYTLYLLGYFYFRLQDYTTAREKLQESISLRPDAKTDKATRELLDNIWKHKIKPPFWTYWFNSPVNTWRRRTFGTFVVLGILLMLFVHAESPQSVAWNETTSDDLRNFFPGQINFYPYIISYPLANNTTSEPMPLGNSTSWNILTPARVNIYPDIPDNYFDALLLLILILALIYPSVRIAENVKLILKKGGDVSLDLGPIAAPPEFNFELSPSLMQDVIKRLDENL